MLEAGFMLILVVDPHCGLLAPQKSITASRLETQPKWTCDLTDREQGTPKLKQSMLLKTHTTIYTVPIHKHHFIAQTQTTTQILVATVSYSLTQASQM